VAEARHGREPRAASGLLHWPKNRRRAGRRRRNMRCSSATPRPTRARARAGASRSSSHTVSRRSACRSSIVVLDGTRLVEVGRTDELMARTVNTRNCTASRPPPTADHLVVVVIRLKPTNWNARGFLFGRSRPASLQTKKWLWTPSVVRQLVRGSSAALGNRCQISRTSLVRRYRSRKRDCHSDVTRGTCAEDWARPRKAVKIL